MLVVSEGGGRQLYLLQVLWGLSGSHFTTLASKSEFLTCAQSVTDLFIVMLEGYSLSPFSHMTRGVWRSMFLQEALVSVI